MTDEELDRATFDEAVRVAEEGSCRSIALTALRLRREGWMPPDPLDAEVRKILGDDLRLWGDASLAYLRKALERGIEIGRTTPDRSDG